MYPNVITPYDQNPARIKHVVRAHKRAESRLQKKTKKRREYGAALVCTKVFLGLTTLYLLSYLPG